LREKKRGKQARSEPRPTPPSSFSGESRSDGQHSAREQPREYQEWLLQVRRRKRELQKEIERQQARLNEVTQQAAERNKLIAKRKAEALAQKYEQEQRAEATGKIVDSLEVKLAHELKEYTKHHMVLSQELELRAQPHAEQRARLVSEKTSIEAAIAERRREIARLQAAAREYEEQLETVVQASIRQHTERVGQLEEEVASVASGGRYLQLAAQIQETELRVSGLKEAVERKRVESELSENLQKRHRGDSRYLHEAEAVLRAGALEADMREARCLVEQTEATLD